MNAAEFDLFEISRSLKSRVRLELDIAVENWKAAGFRIKIVPPPTFEDLQKAYMATVMGPGRNDHIFVNNGRIKIQIPEWARGGSYVPS